MVHSCSFFPFWRLMIAWDLFLIQMLVFFSWQNSLPFVDTLVRSICVLSSFVGDCSGLTSQSVRIKFFGQRWFMTMSKLLNGKLIFAEMTWGWNSFIFTLDFYVKCARSLLTPYLVNGVKTSLLIHFLHVLLAINKWSGIFFLSFMENGFIFITFFYVKSDPSSSSSSISFAFTW